MRGALLALLLLLPAPAWAGSVRALLTQEEVDALVEEILPLVEDEAGRPFLRRPEVVLATPAMLSQVLYREQIHLLSQLSQLSGEQAEEAARSTASSISTGFVGKYGFLDKKLYVVSEGVHHALATRGIEPSVAGEVLEIVLAHELAHALQDQHVDLGRVVSSRPDGDAVMAVNCVVEGHAVWVHERVGRRLGHEEAVDLVARIHGYDPDLPGLSSHPERFYTSYVYGQGRSFVAWHARDGGEDRLWTLLTDPPAASAMILDPASHAPSAAPGWSAPTREAMRRARMQLGQRGWTGTDERVGDFDLREHLIDRCRDDRLADALRAGWRSRATGGSPMLGIELQLLGFVNERAARAFVDRMRFNAQQQLDALLPPVTGAVTGGVTGTVSRFEALASDVSAREVIVLEMAGERQELGTVWVARGPNVIQVVTVNHRVSDRKLARTLERVFRSLDASLLVATESE